MAKLCGRLSGPASLCSTKLAPVLETVTRVLDQADPAVRAREVHKAAERLYGGTLLWSSAKGTLANYSVGQSPRFRRASEGGYVNET